MSDRNSLAYNEVQFVWDMGYSIDEKWIGPVERYEYRVRKRGHGEVIHFCKSVRAAYNFIVKREKGREQSETQIG